jgi:hypothetical protein
LAAKGRSELKELFPFPLFVFYRGDSFNLPALKLELQPRRR